MREQLSLLDADQPVPGETALADLGLDSLATIGLLVELEDRFAVMFPDELLTAETFVTAGSLWRLVADRKAGQQVETVT